ncbi:hypothetical protein POM88_021717 [Heracleum sosnowskyi]|uniref:Uncharacterized protein n=1 Tax=Heracleum sosnowskyi TaxID=360622 RepID=A0AAD8IGD8_9APIA|nr:hypothetical protein POM88_021717 [Heracleum sosnowskyi]
MIDGQAMLPLSVGTTQSGPALTPAEVLVAIHDINPERDGLVLKKIRQPSEQPMFVLTLISYPERDGLVLKKLHSHLVMDAYVSMIFLAMLLKRKIGIHWNLQETIKKKLNSSEGVDGIEELVSGGKKSHGPGWLIGRHGSSLIKTSTQAPPQTDS